MRPDHRPPCHRGSRCNLAAAHRLRREPRRACPHRTARRIRRRQFLRLVGTADRRRLCAQRREILDQHGRAGRCRSGLCSHRERRGPRPRHQRLSRVHERSRCDHQPVRRSRQQSDGARLDFFRRCSRAADEPARCRGCRLRASDAGIRFQPRAHWPAMYRAGAGLARRIWGLCVGAPRLRAPLSRD